MKRWCITVTWRSESEKVLDATSDNVIEDGESPLDVIETMVKALPILSSAGRSCLMQNGEKPDSRETTITLSNNERKRSIRIVQDEEMSDEEDEACAKRVMEWLFSEQTTELLTA